MLYIPNSNYKEADLSKQSGKNCQHNKHTSTSVFSSLFVLSEFQDFSQLKGRGGVVMLIYYLSEGFKTCLESFCS